MSYGLFDCDMRNYGNTFFNLELMKLSSYYKKRGEIVAYSPRFNPEKYTHFIMAKDYLDEYFNYPITDYNNIQTIGRAFSIQKYPAMDLDKEKQKPDLTIYERFRQNPFLKKEDAKFLTTALRGEHLRLSLNGENIWEDFTKQLNFNKSSALFLYDYDLSKIYNARETLEYLLSYYNKNMGGQKVAVKFPITIKSIEEMESWLRIKYVTHNVAFNFNKLIDIDDISFFKEDPRRMYRAKIYYNVTRNITYQDFITKGINQLYQYICVLRTLPLDFLLIYEEEFFLDKRWKEVIDLFNLYIHKYKDMLEHYDVETLKDDSLYNYAKKMSRITRPFKSPISKEKLREIFLFVKNNNYPLFKDFYEYRIEEV